MKIDLTPFIQALFTLMAALITYKLIPWIKARTNKAQQDNMRAAVKVLVFAAEQIYGAGQGREKLEYVKERLAEQGFKVDVDEIEAAVGEHVNGIGSFWDIYDEEEFDEEPHENEDKHEDKPPDAE